MSLPSDLHRWGMDMLKKATETGEPVVHTFSKQDRTVEKLLDMQRELTMKENQTKLQLEALCARFNKLTEEVAALQKKLDLNPDKVHRRLELD